MTLHLDDLQQWDGEKAKIDISLNPDQNSDRPIVAYQP